MKKTVLLLAMVLLATANLSAVTNEITAEQLMAAGWSKSGANALIGSDIRLTFLATMSIDAPRNYLSYYDTLVRLNVTGTAGSVFQGICDDEWMAVGSSPTENAIDHLGMATNQPIPGYTANGIKIFDDYDDLWDGNIDHAINISVTGAQTSDAYSIWTGTQSDGTKSANPVGVANPYPDPMAGFVTYGLCQNTTGTWVNAATATYGAKKSLYAMSPALTVTGPEIPGPDVSRGHQVLLDRGLQLYGMITLQELHKDLDMDRWAESNFTAVDIQDRRYGMYGYLPPAPGMPWGRNLRPPYTDIESYEYPFESNLIRLQLDDEQDITDPDNLAYLVSTIANLHTLHPNVIVHTNHGGSQHTATELRNYMAQVQPDMLMFDTYPFNGNVTGGSPTNLYRDLEKYRKLGLAGNDGTGTEPIPVGMYTQTFYWTNKHKVTESEIRLNNFAAWAFGCKLIDSYLYQREGVGEDCHSVLFTGNDTDNPTAQFYQVAETNRQSLNLGPALVRLISTDARMKMGQHKWLLWTQDNDLPSGVSSWNSSADPYITNITATNLGSKNDGLEGDVIVGYFNPLDASFTNLGHEDDLYFMIVNGLSDEAGSACDCRQLIRLNFNFGASGIEQLLRMSRDTGEVEEVALIHDSGSLYHLDLTLDGGTGDLFKFDNGGTFVPEPTTSLLLLSLFGFLLKR